MRRTWTSTTALITTISLILPSPLFAQTTEEQPEFMCADGSDLPCAEGIEQLPTADMICEDGAELPCAADVFAVPKSVMICADGAELPCAEGVAAEVRPEMVDVLTAMREQALVVPSAGSEPAEAGAAAESAAEPEAAPEAEMTEEAASASESEVPEEETATSSDPADAPAAEMTDDAIPAEAPDTSEAAADSVAEADAVEEAPAEEMTDEAALAEALEQEAESAAENATEAVVEEPEAAVDDAGNEETAAADEQPPADEPAETADAEPAPVPDLPVQPDAATGEAPVAAAADAPAEVESTAEVTEEVVTEDTARSSDEDFANKVNETAKAAAGAAAGAAPSASDDDGLSKGEKAILLGLGAIAVGAILSNNREVALNSGDRVVVSRDDGSYEIIKDDNALLRQPGSTVRTETFDDGSTRTTVTREDGTKIVTIRDAEYRVLRRVHVAVDGTETLLIDDTVDVEPVDIATLPAPAEQANLSADADEAALRAALARAAAFDRRFSLAQVRNISQVRSLVPVIDLDAITFETGSAAIRPDQARSLSRLGRLIQSYVDDNPREVFLIEGHTDAVGSAAYNLALSDRRAESVALALTEYFAVPPENLVVQGYGEEFLKIDTQEDERANRRASVRRITDLLRQASN